MTENTFSEQDAQALIQTAQSAPLQNMKHAEMVSGLLQRFAAFYKAATAPVEPPGVPTDA